eukprot:GDKJ01023551.1.p1 GENE.GDKJ01023551.1~~GDKJ01023551.1.p1  ORF type:complete len:256 (+),score=60.40 GDKJ01023551.1:31-798(+)
MLGFRRLINNHTSFSRFFLQTASRSFASGFKVENATKYSFKSAAYCVIVCATMGATFLFLEKRAKDARQVAVTESTVVGKPQLGGDWTLTDGSGKSVSAKDFNGKYQIIYFGFVNCPDICPVEIEKQIAVLEKIEKEFGEGVLQPIFITVDPMRDGPAQIKEYVAEFSPKLVGLTGTVPEIKAVTKLFRVYFNQGIKSTDEDYLIDHSIIHYLMSPTNQFKEFYGKNMTVNETAESIAKIIRTDREARDKRRSSE